MIIIFYLGISETEYFQCRLWHGETHTELRNNMTSVLHNTLHIPWHALVGDV